MQSYYICRNLPFSKAKSKKSYRLPEKIVDVSLNISSLNADWLSSFPNLEKVYREQLTKVIESYPLIGTVQAGLCMYCTGGVTSNTGSESSETVRKRIAILCGIM